MVSIPFPYFPIKFDKDARVIAPGDADLKKLLQDANKKPTDLIVISHGWNNDIAEAEDLYSELLTNAGNLLKEGKPPGLSGRKFAVLGVLWPSKKFADSELIPGNAAGTGDTMDIRALSKQLDSMKGGFDSPKEAEILEALKALLPKLKNSDTACEDFVKLARSLVKAGSTDASDGADRFFSEQPIKIFKKLERPVSFTQPVLSGSTVGAAALGIGDFFSGIQSAARNVLNLTTYYQMKERAGIVGSTALNPMLRIIAQQNPQLRIHLVGHSFGGRLLTATAAGTDVTTVLKAHSMTLLQAAFSHYGFAKNWDKKNHDGFFRRVVKKHAIFGPIVITHTVNDKAVGMAYPLASLLAGQNAAGLGDKDSDYGGIGRNGAQKTPEAANGDMVLAGGKYTFEAGRLHNLNALNRAGDLIKDHGDVRNRDVAYAVLSAIATATT
ncbi:hypothetical protein [Methyloglobulus sp.]|uniref:hypothetical protein n=1 Tax=Methyloglobulus sp. TaxID=2518622 RepID=UPI003988B120